MILLDNTTRRLQVLLGGAGAIPFVASWVVVHTVHHGLTGEGTATGVTNGTTPVDLVGVPAASSVRQVKLIWVRNSTAGAVSATIRYDDNGTSRDMVFSLDAGDLLQYTDGEGFRVFTSAGALKGGGTSGGGVTVEEVDGAPTITATKIKFAQADGLTVTDEGGGVARVNFGGSVSASNSRRVPWMLGG